MGGTPERPPAVPDAAGWVDEAREWRWGVVDAAGQKQGTHRSWRPDGSLREEVAFVDGKGVGPYLLLHPNGQIAGRGEFVDGNMQGTLRAFASDGPTPELLQPCCVPPNAWELQSDYHHGQLMARRWYNRDGQQILESGAPRPPLPASVPADARYDEGSERWLVGDYGAGPGQAGAPAVHWRRWSRAGVLVEEEQVENDARHGILRRYRESDGAPCLDVRYQRGLKHGPFRDDTIPAGVFLDPCAVSEEGSFDRDLATGVWRLRDAAGSVVVQRDLGVAATDESLAVSPALAVVVGTPAEAARRLVDLSRTLRGERRVGEAILALARAAALAGDAGELRALLAQATWPRAPAAATDLATSAIEGARDRLAPLVDAVVRGGEAVALFRALAGAMKGAYRAALQIIDAGLLLAGEHLGAVAGSFVTRSLVNVHLGAPEEAARDVQRLPAGWSEQRTQLLDYQRVIFPTYDFWPARVTVRTMFEEYPEAPAQPLAAVHDVVRKLATRLSLLRAALSLRLREGATGDPPPGAVAGAGAAWFPPDLSALLPDGPVALGISTFEQSFVPDQEAADETDDEAPPDAPAEPAQVETISIDETLALDGATIPALQRLARGDWAALTWLCWSCGLDRVALPQALEPPAAFGPAAGMSIERAWRCRDKLTSGGLVAMTKGVPSFEWEGMQVDVMPRVLAEVMTEEHLEVRAIFLWLCDGTARSPWQSDLRDAD